MHKKAFRKSSPYIQNPLNCGPTDKYADLSKIANVDSFNNLLIDFIVSMYVHCIGKITRDKQFADNSLQICESTKKLVDDNFLQMYVLIRDAVCPSLSCVNVSK